MTTQAPTKTEMVVTLHAQGLSAKEIGDRVGITESTVRSLAWHKGLRFETASRRRASREDFIRDAYAENMPVAEIAKALGSTVGSIKVTASRLGCSKQGGEIISYRRGFTVPEHLLTDYQNLMRKGGYKSREAAVALGICEQGA